jgi:hypothetical protein
MCKLKINILDIFYREHLFYIITTVDYNRPIKFGSKPKLLSLDQGRKHPQNTSDSHIDKYFSALIYVYVLLIFVLSGYVTRRI